MQRNLRRPRCLAPLLLLGACMVGPDYERPEVEVNPSFVESGDARIDVAVEVQVEWWKSLSDPVLDGLIEKAYAQNLSLRSAGVRVLQSMAVRGIAVGQLFPQVQEIGGAATRSRASENGPGAGAYSSSWGAGFDAAWELDFWGRFRRTIEAADAELDVSFASYDSVMVSLASEVALVYVGIRTLQQRLAIAQENVKQQEDGLRLANARAEAGATSELDPTQALTLLAQTRAAIPALEVALRQAMYRLDFLLGESPRDILDELGDAGKIPTPPPRLAVGIPADLLRRRPDIRLAERVAAAQSARIGVATADLYPAFFLSGSIGLQATEFDDLFKGGSWTGGITPGFSWPVFNYGRISNNIRARDAAFQAAIIDYRNAVLAAAQEVESGIVAFLGSQDRLARLQEAVSHSQRALELSKVQYAEGTADFQRVLDAMSALRQVQDALTVTQGDVVNSLIVTQKALGGGWEVHLDEDIVPEETRREMRERTDWGGLLDPVESPTREPGVDAGSG